MHTELKKRKSKKIKDLACWGHPPPPYGGMTVHIARLIPKLEEANITYQMYNFSGYNNDEDVIHYRGSAVIFWFLKLFLGYTEKIHYILTTRSNVRFIAVLAGIIRKKKIIIRIGGASLYKGLKNGKILDRFFNRFALRYASTVIGVNQNICDLAIQAGAHADNVKLIPGFIPPKNNEFSIPESVKQFYSTKSPKLLATGILTLDPDKDIYGLLNIVKMIKDLLHYYPFVGLVIFAQNGSKEKDKQLFQSFREYLTELGVQDSVFLYGEAVELWPSMSICDLFLRPSLSDGDANSIREALYLGIPVIASDCVERPESVITYKTGQIDLLTEKLIIVLNNLNFYKVRVKNLSMPDYSQSIISIINDHINAK